MSGSWICASCRRTLRRQARRSASAQALRGLAYIPFQPPTEQLEEERDSFENYRRPRARRRAPGHIDWQFDKSVENDFIQRVSESSARKAGPYSRVKPRQGDTLAEQTLQDLTSTARDTIHAKSMQVPPKVFKRNGAVTRVHPLDLEEPTRQRRPWFGIPSGHTALTDLGYAVPDPSSHKSLNASLSISPPLNEDAGDASAFYTYQSPKDGKRLSATQAKSTSFFDQYFEQARGHEPPSSEPTPVQEALKKLSTAHRLALPALDNEQAGLPLNVHDANSRESHLNLESVNHKNGVYVKNNAADGNLPSAGQNDIGHAKDKHEQCAKSDDEKHPAEAWKELIQLSPNEKKKLGRTVVHNLCRKIVSAWCVKGSAYTRVPKPTKVLQALHPERPKVEQAALSMEVLWTVLSHAISRAFEGADEANLQDFTLVNHVLEVWASILRDFAECYVRDSNGIIQQLRGSEDWSSFIASEQMTRIEQTPDRSLKARLFETFPKEYQTSLASIDSAALATWALLERFSEGTMDKVNQSELTAIAPALSFFSKLASRVKDNMTVHSRALHKRCLSEQDSTRISNEIKHLVQSAWPETAAPETITPLSTKAIGSEQTARDAQRPLSDLFKKRVARAIESQDSLRLERVWRKIQTEYGAEETEASSYAAIPSQLYAHLLTGFMALGRPNRAIDIWNSMTSCGLTPSMEHWDAMLKGCGVARNPDAAQVVWQNLIAAGVTPDAQLWATRIYSLGLSGRIEAAVQAFETMAIEWLQASMSRRGDRKASANGSSHPTYPKPNTQCLNALVAVLARANRHSQLVNVLSWRKRLEIKADSFTYNPLLKAALRDENLDLASKLVQQMRASGVDPDIATFTMMLDSAFQGSLALPAKEHKALPSHDSTDLLQLDGTPRDSSPLAVPAMTASQASALGLVFELMARQSLKPTAHTFTALVTGLLRSEPPNTKAAYGILQYLGSHGLPLSPQIYTALVTHHFERSPADVAAVDALWRDANHRRKTDRSLILDAFFYDRFIAGWSRSGHIDQALQVRRVAKARGKLQSWEALRELLQSLARVQEWGAAQALVREVILEEQNGGSDQTRSSKGYANFWEAVEMLGLDNERMVGP